MKLQRPAVMKVELDRFSFYTKFILNQIKLELEVELELGQFYNQK